MESTLNRHLWLLTGRCNDFVSPVLNTGRRYGDAPPSRAVTEARRILHLADKTTDYYVIGAMAALVTSRHFLSDDISTVFLPRNLHVLAPTISGGELRPAGPQHPTMLHRPTSLPVARRWYVRRVSNAEVKVTSDTGGEWRLPFRFVSGVVYIDWPPEIGFHAAFAPSGGLWVDGSEVIISTEPSGFPYQAVASALKNSNLLVRLMAETGTLSAFHAAQSSLQKVGALTAAVVKWGAATNP